VALRKKHGWGARKIHDVLNLDVSVRTINRIIERNGLLIPEDCHRPALSRFERPNPNDLWQTDLKGVLGRGDARCEPLTILDDYSRFALGLFPASSCKLEPIQAAFQRTFQKYGVPQEMLMDHGIPWWTSAQYLGLTRLSVWLMKQDVKLIFCGFNHPQTQGKVERFHRTLAEAVRHYGTPKQFDEWSKLLSKIRRVYNNIRPHEALGMKTPASRYTPSKRAFNPRPKGPEYPANSHVVKVDTLGRFSFRNKRLFASEALSNEYVRLEQLEDSLVVFYRKSPIREIDLKTGQSFPWQHLRKTAKRAPY